MTENRHGEINDNITLMLANAQYALKRMDRSNVASRVTGVRPFIIVGAVVGHCDSFGDLTDIELNGLVLPYGIYHMEEDE